MLIKMGEVRTHSQLALPEQKSRLGGPFAQFLDRLLEETQKVYGDRLVTLAIFGSVGRGTASPESDVDLLIVATDSVCGQDGSAGH